MTAPNRTSGFHVQPSQSVSKISTQLSNWQALIEQCLAAVFCFRSTKHVKTIIFYLLPSAAPSPGNVPRSFLPVSAPLVNGGRSDGMEHLSFSPNLASWQTPPVQEFAILDELKILSFPLSEPREISPPLTNILQLAGSLQQASSPSNHDRDPSLPQPA